MRMEDIKAKAVIIHGDDLVKILQSPSGLDALISFDEESLLPGLKNATIIEGTLPNVDAAMRMKIAEFMREKK